jgi:hypothetical protein
MRVYIEGIGICGPGLAGWSDSIAALSGAAPYQSTQTIIPVPGLLPPTERRRTVPTVRLALAVGIEALENAQRDAKDTATVFTSSGGDGETMHAILEVLASDTREVSPTRFHNSVHNAPSGYWNIAVGSHEPTTSICAYDASFAAGLLDAAAQATIDNRAVAMVAYDLPYPEPLASVREIVSIFGVGIVLTPLSTPHTMAQIDIDIAQESATTLYDPALETLRKGNPAARSLPLLAAIAGRQSQTVQIDYLPGSTIAIHVTC